MFGHFDCSHSCLIEKNVHIAFILPSRWKDGAESLEIKTKCCLWLSWITLNQSAPYVSAVPSCCPEYPDVHESQHKDRECVEGEAG